MSDKCHVKGQFLDVCITVGELLVISLKLMTKRVEDELSGGLFSRTSSWELNIILALALPFLIRENWGGNLENCVILKSHRHGLIIVQGGMCDFFSFITYVS